MHLPHMGCVRTLRTLYAYATDYGIEKLSIKCSSVSHKMTFCGITNDK